jgi:cobalt-zinc-cadmium efflux system membrane fusion protein
MQHSFQAGLLPGVAAVLGVVSCLAGCGSQAAGSIGTHDATANAPGSGQPNESVELSPTQLRSIAVQSVTQHVFAPRQEAVGNIDFDEDMTVQVSAPYPGRIVRLLAKAGDKVRKGQLLFTIESPDLVQAESTLMSSAGVLKLTTGVLKRARGLYAIQGIAQKDYEQAVSDQQAAEAAYKAARDAVRIFGKTEGPHRESAPGRCRDADSESH